jgi:hypothetical protein
VRFGERAARFDLSDVEHTMKINEAISELDRLTQFDVVLVKTMRIELQTLIELCEAPFPCGYPESTVHDAVAGVRPVLIECVAGMVTTDEARGLVADLIRAIDEAEAR